MALPILFRGSPVGALGDPRDPFWSLRGSMDRLFEDLRGAPVGASPEGFSPRIDVVEREAEYLVAAELPGLEEKDFQLEVHGNVLTLSGEKRLPEAEGSRGWRWAERSYGRFRRSLQLPVEVDAAKASAAFKHGVLTVTLPKAESARVRHIPVNES